ncbi:serine/threonine protein kinase [Streptomyces sp. NPDC048436]|uniref:serine/threonine protein kinase n=1 Tax=Streptomyces sp. NPDC048436 TaxID=3365550 RepID=UPI00371DBDB1
MDELAPDDAREIAGYRLRARLGEGGMGVVYLSHTRGGQPVALKVVRREYAQDPEFRQRFTQEVTAARRVQGPYTAPVLDSFTEGPEPWLAVSYVPGPALSSAVYEHGVLPVPTVLQLIAGIAEALQTIHTAGVIHRDLKPSNVLLAADGPRVIDFGIARAADTTALTGTDVRLGTPAYMAPEQAMGGEVTPALDIFALGLVAYFAATRRHPFGDGSSHALLYRIVSNEPDLSTCPEQLRGLIAACLAKEPSARPTPAQLVEACASLAGTSGLARQEGWWLPPAVAQQIARQEQEQTMRLQAPGAPAPAASSGVPGVFGAPAAYGTPAAPPVPTQPAHSPGAAYAAAVPTQPAQTPGQAFASAAPTRPAQTPHHQPQPQPAKRRRPWVLPVVATVGVLAVGGGSVAAYKLMGEGDKGSSASGSSAGGGSQGSKVDGKPGGSETDSGADKAPAGPKTEPGWQVSAQNKPLTLRAPKFYPNSKDVGLDSMCRPSDVTTLEVNDLEVETNKESLSSAGPYLTYTDCAEPLSRNGIRLADKSGGFGTITEERPTPSACRTAARGADLPNPIPLSKIRNDALVKKDTGICIESGEGAVTHLWITKVNEEPENDNLRTYVMTATQWKPE